MLRGHQGVEGDIRVLGASLSCSVCRLLIEVSTFSVKFLFSVVL